MAESSSFVDEPNRKFPAREVYFTRNIKRRIYNRATETLRRQLDAKPLLKLKDLEPKPCAFLNLPPDTRFIPVKCLDYPKQSVRGYTYSSNAGGSGLRPRPRLECLTRHCGQSLPMFWNYTRDFLAHQIASCTDPLNPHRCTDVDTLKLLIPPSAQYKTCSTPVKSDVQKQAKRAAERVETLRRFSLYDTILDEELNRWSSYSSRRDEKMLYALKEFSYKADPTQRCGISEFKPKYQDEKEEVEHKTRSGFGGEFDEFLVDPLDDSSPQPKTEVESKYPDQDVPDISHQTPELLAASSLLKKFHLQDRKIVAHAIPHIITEQEVCLRKYITDKRNKILQEKGVLVPGGDRLSKYPPKDHPCFTPPHSITTEEPTDGEYDALYDNSDLDILIKDHIVDNEDDDPDDFQDDLDDY